ncbi:MAG: Oxidoreductase, Gfo/Idh/MocA family [Phenylobacterium sp.]|jgi:predicted dehydrogenase|nr:Oxidoreductase, Gfo/Idh/MocA family [Phenylobacterium sp.]
MASAELGVGVIGTGVGARVHAPAVANTPGARVVALCGGDAERTGALARKLGVPRATGDVHELVAMPEVDLVCVASPPHLHHAAVTAALAAGKHVVCEKPFALDAGQAREMLELARARGVRHVMNHEFRLSPALVELRRRMAAGELGTLQQVVYTGAGTFARTQQGRLGDWWFDAARGGGWLGAAGSHRIDSFRWLFGEIEAVAATLETRVRHPTTRDGPVEATADDGFTLLMRFAGGATGCCVSTAAAGAAGPPDRMVVMGDAGTLTVEGERLFAGGPDGGREIALKALQALPGEDRVQTLVRHWMGAIVEAVRDDAPLRPDFEDGWRCQLVMDAAREAARDGRWVRIADGG